MEFQQKLSNYAELIIKHGLNIQPGQLLNINAEVIHRELVLLISEKAYQAGAKFVNVSLSDARLGKVRINHSNNEDLLYTNTDLKARYTEILSSKGANLSLVGSEYPTILEGCDPTKINAVRMARHKAIKQFYDDGIGKSQVHWTVAAAASQAWGQQVFPHLEGQDAEDALWQEIFRICRVDQPNFLEIWQKHNTQLQLRAKHLTELQIDYLHFKGPETDLYVHLSAFAKWKGGSETGPLAVDFEPNLPTEEVFTTPDCKKTSGTVAITRPVEVNGVLIKNLKLEFKEGELVDFSASSGMDTFKAFISSDPGAKKLGEVALVGVDSPIFQSGLVFNEILFDENAACHIALGSAYKFCLSGADNMKPAELEKIGCNESSVHTDFMISSEQVDVVAYLNNGTSVQLIRKGAWVLS